MGFVGLDVIAIQTLARNLTTQAADVRGLATDLNGAIANTAWFGQDQAAFLGDWQSNHQPALLRAAGLLEEAARIAQQSATNQDRVSRS